MSSGTERRGLEVRFRSPDLEVMSAVATIVRSAQSLEPAASWVAENLVVTDGVTHCDYGGPPGRFHVLCRNLMVRAVARGSEYAIENYIAAIDVTQANLDSGHVTIDMPERVIAILEVRSVTGQPLHGVEVSVYRGDPEPVSFRGSTESTGEFPLLARPGYYSATINDTSRQSFKIEGGDIEERVVLIVGPP